MNKEESEYFLILYETKNKRINVICVECDCNDNCIRPIKMGMHILYMTKLTQEEYLANYEYIGVENE